MLNREIKFWMRQDSLLLVDKFTFCEQAFGNHEPALTALKAAVKRDFHG